VRAASEHFRAAHDVVDVDGVRVLFGDGWGLLRASNTQPVLVLRFEARTAERSTPAFFEVGFGPSPGGEAAPGEPHMQEPLEIDLGDGRSLRVSGRIDRIDRRPVVLEREVGVAGRVLAAKAGDFATHADEAELVLDRAFDGVRELGDREFMGIALRSIHASDLRQGTLKVKGSEGHPRMLQRARAFLLPLREKVARSAG